MPLSKSRGDSESLGMAQQCHLPGPVSGAGSETLNQGQFLCDGALRRLPGMPSVTAQGTPTPMWPESPAVRAVMAPDWDVPFPAPVPGRPRSVPPVLRPQALGLLLSTCTLEQACAPW